jgi:TetR/AcrR family transcriptional regulator, repressor of fatR-cypB operon
MDALLVQRVIRESSKELFRKFGYHKTSVNEIAKRSRIAKATIYKYFDSKELILNQIIMEHLSYGIQDLVEKFHPKVSKEEKLSALILKTSRLSYAVCNEFIGWDFIRENVNSQEFLKNFSNELETLLIATFKELPEFGDKYQQRLSFLVKSSKSIVFSFAFTSVTDSDVRKNFITFEKEILPFLVKATLD